MILDLKSPVRGPMPSTGYSIAQDLATGIKNPGKVSASLGRAGLKQEAGQGAGMGRAGVSSRGQEGRQRVLPISVPLEEVWVSSVLLSLEGDVCCGAWCTWIAWTGTC